MNRLIPILLLLPLSVLADVYKWVDEMGTIHYSDEAGKNPDATRVPSSVYESPLPSRPSPPLSSLPAMSQTTPLPGDSEMEATSYSVTIVSPTRDATIRDNRGMVPVTVSTTPRPRKGLAYQVYLDGKPWYEPVASDQFTLSNVDRGTHRIKVQLLDSAGNLLDESGGVTFHLHRASVLKRAR
jgi:hypothetical protein